MSTPKGGPDAQTGFEKNSLILPVCFSTEQTYKTVESTAVGRCSVPGTHSRCPITAAVCTTTASHHHTINPVSEAAFLHLRSQE